MSKRIAKKLIVASLIVIAFVMAAFTVSANDKNENDNSDLDKPFSIETQTNNFLSSADTVIVTYSCDICKEDFKTFSVTRGTDFMLVEPSQFHAHENYFFSNFMSGGFYEAGYTTYIEGNKTFTAMYIYELPTYSVYYDCELCSEKIPLQYISKGEPLVFDFSLFHSGDRIVDCLIIDGVKYRSSDTPIINKSVTVYIRYLPENGTEVNISTNLDDMTAKVTLSAVPRNHRHTKHNEDFILLPPTLSGYEFSHFVSTDPAAFYECSLGFVLCHLYCTDFTTYVTAYFVPIPKFNITFNYYGEDILTLEVAKNIRPNPSIAELELGAEIDVDSDFKFAYFMSERDTDIHYSLDTLPLAIADAKYFYEVEECATAIFKSNGEVINIQKLTKGTVPTLPSIPEWAGHKFKFWYSNGSEYIAALPIISERTEFVATFAVIDEAFTFSFNYGIASVDEVQYTKHIFGGSNNDIDVLGFFMANHASASSDGAIYYFDGISNITVGEKISNKVYYVKPPIKTLAKFKVTFNYVNKDGYLSSVNQSYIDELQPFTIDTVPSAIKDNSNLDLVVLKARISLFPHANGVFEVAYLRKNINFRLPDGTLGTKIAVAYMTECDAFRYWVRIYPAFKTSYGTAFEENILKKHIDHNKYDYYFPISSGGVPNEYSGYFKWRFPELVGVLYSMKYDTDGSLVSYACTESSGITSPAIRLMIVRETETYMDFETENILKVTVHNLLNSKTMDIPLNGVEKISIKLDGKDVLCYEYLWAIPLDFIDNLDLWGLLNIPLYGFKVTNVAKFDVYRGVGLTLFIPVREDNEYKTIDYSHVKLEIPNNDDIKDDIIPPKVQEGIDVVMDGLKWIFEKFKNFFNFVGSIDLNVLIPIAIIIFVLICTIPLWIPLIPMLISLLFKIVTLPIRLIVMLIKKIAKK